MSFTFDPTAPPDYITFGDQTLFDGLTAMTFHAVVRPNNITADQYIIAKNDSSFNGIILFLDAVVGGGPDGNCWQLFLNNGTAVRIYADASATANQWNTITARFDIGATGGDMWVDGVKVASGVNTNSFAGGMTNNTSGLVVGIDSGINDFRAFDGEIADLAVWDFKADDAMCEGLQNGFHSNFYTKNRIFSVPLNNDEDDIYGLDGTAIQSPSLAEEPPLIRPCSKMLHFQPVAAPATGRIMSSLVNKGGLAGQGGLAGSGGGLAA